jgi:4-hydroxythreonine-4-phosphate dehydrogenase
MHSNTNNLPILITQGDAAGIGPEIIAKLFKNHPQDAAGCVVVGDVRSMRRAAALVAGPGDTTLPLAQLQSLSDAPKLPPGCLPVLSISELSAHIPYAQVSPLAGKLAADCIRFAAGAALRGEAAAVVTAPIHKEALAAAGEPHPGHTELLQAQAAQFLNQPVSDVPVRMMLANDELRTVLVSIHMSLRDALAAVTPANVLQSLQIAHQALLPVLGRAPRIGVAGLNPHAGEGGLFGNEELEVIAPAIATARAQGIDVHGPFAPDTIFMRARHTPQKTGEFDVVLAMYHDQGLIPVKYLGVEQGVNVTLGLPFVRTSPDHGTAFDIAGQGRADESSLLAALRMARTLTRFAK